MKSTKAVRLLLAALLICLLLSGTALAASTVIEGDAEQAVEFYVYPSAAATLTFTQEKGTLDTTAGMRRTVYGGYDITWYPSAQPAAARTVTMTGRTAAISLSRNTYYTVRVVPHTLDKLQSRDAYLGYPGSYQRWVTPSEWSLTGANNCQLSWTPLGYAPTATPNPYAYLWQTPTPTTNPYAYLWWTPSPTPNPYAYLWATATPTPNPYAYLWQTATPAPQPAATVYIFYRQADGSLITYSTEKLTPGTHLITGKLNGSYFTPISSNYQVVTVSAAGVADPPSVTFYYQYNSGSGAYTVRPTATPTPTPIPSVAVQICYKQTDGVELYRETRMLAPGTHMITYDHRFDYISWLSFLGPASYNVTVYPNGTVSAETITFYFSSMAGYSMPVYTALTPSPTPIPQINESLTDQEAIIGAEKIYPRPQPGKGKNTFNYEAVGQKVIVHSKAKSLQNDGSWWVCISAQLKCWGTTYVIDHEWIKTTYLNPRSYDLNTVPLDPNYT